MVKKGTKSVYVVIEWPLLLLLLSRKQSRKGQHLASSFTIINIISLLLAAEAKDSIGRGRRHMWLVGYPNPCKIEQS